MLETYLNAADDDRVAITIEDVLSLGVSIYDQGHTPRSTREGCKYALYRKLIFKCRNSDITVHS